MSQQVPYPAGPPGPPQGLVRLTIQGNELTSNLIVPTVLVNGYQARSRYGVLDLPVYAGVNRIEVYAQWLRRYGQAVIDVTVAPGQVVELWYAAPMHQFTTGSIGYTKQPRKGLAAFVAVGLVVLVPILLMTVGIFTG